MAEHDRVLDRDARDRGCEHGEEEGRGVPEVGPAVAVRRRSPGGSRGRDASRRCWRGRCRADARSAGPSPSCRMSRTSPMMCGPGRSEGSRSQDTASCPRARKASRTTPENSQATRTRMAVTRRPACAGASGRSGSGSASAPEPLGLHRGEAAAVAVEHRVAPGLGLPALDDHVDIRRVESPSRRAARRSRSAAISVCRCRRTGRAEPAARARVADRAPTRSTGFMRRMQVVASRAVDRPDVALVAAHRTVVTSRPPASP